MSLLKFLPFETSSRDVILYKAKGAHPNGRDTVRIDEFNKGDDPAAYVLILPYGDDGCCLPGPSSELSVIDPPSNDSIGYYQIPADTQRTC